MNLFLVSLMPLIALAKEEDLKRGELFEVLVLKHQKKLFGVAYEILQNRYDAEDALQNAFTNVWTHFDSFEGRPVDDVKALLITYVSNAAKDIRRKKTAKKNNTVPLGYEDGDSEAEAELPDAFDMDEVILTMELAEKLVKCVAKLPEADRQLILLRYHYHYSSKKISEVMNISIGNVNIKMKRVKAKLYKMMEEYLNG